MAQTVANLSAVLKDAWTSDRIQKQFYNKNPILDKIGSVAGTMIGQQAQVPIHSGRNGGYTSTLPAGGALNPAGQQEVDQALYTMVYHWFQIALETAALAQSGSNSQSIIAAKDLEMKGAIDDMSKQCSRQLVGNGDGVLAVLAGNASSATIPLLTTGYGRSSLVRGHIHAGQTVDIGAVGTPGSTVQGAKIIAVDKQVAAPSITLDAPVVVAANAVLTIANPNGTTVANPELNGFRNIAGSNASLGGINPATAGFDWWAPALVDNTTTTLTLDGPLNLQQAVFEQTGEFATSVFTSPKQAREFYSLLQNQVRFAGEMGMGAGNVGGLVGLSWNGQGINVVPDIADRDWYNLTLADFVRVTGGITTPTWTSELEGSGGDVRWSPGTTSFVEGLVWPFQIGVQRRNTHAAMTNLTV